MAGLTSRSGVDRGGMCRRDHGHHRHHVRCRGHDRGHRGDHGDHRGFDRHDPTSGESIKLGILAECEGAFGGFNEDVVAGVTLALINHAGATSNSTTTALDGFANAVAGGREIELVGIGCGDDTADRIIQEIRTLVEENGAEIVIGPLSGDESIAVANYAKDHPEITVLSGIAGAQETTLQVQAPNYFRFHGDGAQWNAGLGDILHNQAGWDTAAIIVDDYSFGWTSSAGFIADFCAVGGTIAEARIYPPLGTTDYSSFIQQLTPMRSTVTSGLSAAPGPRLPSKRSSTRRAS